MCHTGVRSAKVCQYLESLGYNVRNLNSSMIEFISWFSKYNLVPLGMSLKMCLLNKDVVEKDFNKEFVKFKVKKS